MTVSLSYTLEDALSLVKFRSEPGGLLSPEAYREKAPILGDYFSKRFQLTDAGESGVARLVTAVFPGEQPLPRSSLRTSLGLILTYHWTHPVGHLRIRCTLLQDVVRDARHLTELSDGRAFVFDKDRPEAEFPARPGLGAALARFWVPEVRLLLLLVPPGIFVTIRRLRKIRGGPDARLLGGSPRAETFPGGPQGPVQMHP